MQLVKKVISIFIFVSFFFMPFYIKAAEIPLTQDDINVETIPDSPAPYENVQIKLNSYSTNLNEAKIEWRSGSNTVQSGTGKTTYSFRALGPNQITIFDITITPIGSGEVINKRVAVNPTEIDMLIESVDGYTPPFYKGASFITPEATIRVTAIPNTNIIKQGKGSVTYTWKADDNTNLDVSGYNKDSFTFRNNNLNDTEKITVTASTIGGRFSGTKNINIPIINPKVLFYKHSPDQGILYNSALQNGEQIKEDEVSITACPYFLPIRDKENYFNYNWKVNGESIETPSGKNEITIRPSSRGGFATLDITFENFNSLFQKISGQLKINL